VGVYIFAYRNTEFTCVCLCMHVSIHRVYIWVRTHFRICTQRLHVGVYTFTYRCRDARYARIGTRSFYVGVQIFAFIHTEFTCVLIYLRVYTQSFHVGVYIFTYMYTEVTSG